MKIRPPGGGAPVTFSRIFEITSITAIGRGLNSRRVNSDGLPKGAVTEAKGGPKPLQTVGRNRFLKCTPRVCDAMVNPTILLTSYLYYGTTVATSIKGCDMMK